MKTIFLITLSSLISFFSIIDAAQAKTKKETEHAIVCIKRESAPRKAMLSFAYTPGPCGYRIEDVLGSNEPMRLFVKSPLFKTEAGKRKLMYNLHACKDIPSAIYQFLTKAMNAAQEKAIGAHDHAVSTWEYKKGTVKLINSIPLPKEKQSSDYESDQTVDDTIHNSGNESMNDDE